MTLEERLAVLASLLRALGQAASLSAHRLGIKPAHAPEVEQGQVASIGAFT